MDGGDEVCNGCEPSRQAAAEPQPIQPSRITLAPPLKQPYLAQKPKLADFYHVRPGQSLEPFKALINSRQYAGGVSKRGTDSNKGFQFFFFNVSFFNLTYVVLKHPSLFTTDWSKIASIGPLFLIPKQEITTQSPGSLQSGPAEVLSSVAEEPELLFNSTETSPVTELEFKTDQETESSSPLEKGLFLNASDLFSSEEGSGFEP